MRALAPFVAGSSGLSYRRFAPFSIIGCGLWATIFSVLGFVFYRSFDRVAEIAGKATFAFGLTVAVIVGGVYVVPPAAARGGPPPARRLDRGPARPAARSIGASWRPSYAWRGPAARFLLDRLTPGQLGLELTTTSAVAGVGIYVFTLYTVILSTAIARPRPRTASCSTSPRTSIRRLAVDVAKVVTELGAFAAVAALLFGVGAVLAAHRHFAELVALVAGAVLIYVGVQLTKSGVDRPRPAGALVETEGSSFPSGHAAYSTVWIGVAVVAARVLPGIASRAALVATGVAIAAVVGLSRIYLRVHYWSDVAAGWGLGAGVLGACAAVALVVVHFRNNGQPGMDAPPRREPRPDHNRARDRGGRGHRGRRATSPSSSRRPWPPTGGCGRRRRRASSRCSSWARCSGWGRRLGSPLSGPTTPTRSA